MKLISAVLDSMSDKEGEKDTDNESLSDWTLVNQEETIEGDQDAEDELEESSEGAVGPPKDIEEEDEEEEEEEDDDEEEVEEVEEEEVKKEATVGKSGSKVEELKGNESSDIETLDYPGVEDALEYHIIYNEGVHLGLQNLQYINYNRDYSADADNESVSSSGTPEEKVRKRRSRKPEATQDEETDLSLASSPSLPEDLPSIRPEPQYIHTPDQKLNSRLNAIVAFTLVCVLGLAIGHFLGWSSRTSWEENINAAQIIINLEVENEGLQSEILSLQASNLEPIKIKGREGKEARELREKINQLISDNEDMRLAIARVQYNLLPDADRGSFNRVVQENHHLRTTVAKLTHMRPDLKNLKSSIEFLEQQNKELVASVAKIRYEQPMPRELKPVVKEMESVKQAVIAELHKKKPSSNLLSAKSYLVFMSQILSAFNSLNDDEVGLIDKVDLARDVFTLVVPKGVKIPPSAQEKVILGRSKFKEIRESLQRKWIQLKELTKPKFISEMAQSTLSKMNRVIVNVVNKIKDIGHATLLKQNKKPVELIIATMADKISILDEQFDKTWKSLQNEVPLAPEEKEEIFGSDYVEPVANENVNNDDEEDENILLAGSKSEVHHHHHHHLHHPSKEREEKSSELDFKKHMLMKEEENKKIEIKVKERLASEVNNLNKKTKKAVKEQIQKKTKKDNKEEIIKENPKKEAKENQKLPAKLEEKMKVERAKEVESHKVAAERTKFHVKELPKHTTEPEVDARYFKGQYNKFDKLKSVEEEEETTGKKYFKRNEDDDDDEDEDEENDDVANQHRRSKKPSSKHDKAAVGGLKSLWEKPHNKKSSFHEETDASKKLFIKRRG